VYTRSNGEDEVLNVALLQELGEERRPVRLDLDVGRLHDRGDLLGLPGRKVTESLNRSKTVEIKRTDSEGEERTVMAMPSSLRMRAA
jgi:hypothetical protein